MVKFMDFKHLRFVSVLFMVLLLLSCCVSSVKDEGSANKKESVEEEPLTKINSEPLLPDMEMKINGVYREMVSGILSKDSSLASSNISWFQSLTDDGKYFYAIGVSNGCASEKAARTTAERDAVSTLIKNAKEVSGKSSIDTAMWQVDELRSFKSKKESGKYRYSAVVLIRIDRNRIVE